VETDSMHHYRLPKKVEGPPKKWVSPQIKAILQKSSKDFSKIYDVGEEKDAE